MSFSASTCLSNTGTATLGPTLIVYSNPISPSNPGTFVISVPTNDITGGNCPYTLELPDGTTSIRLFDPISGCYTDIEVNDSDICTTCDLGFDSVANNQLSTIYIGNLTGSCENPITDYKIEWYGPDSTSTLAFTSGEGTEFPHVVDHPITPSSLDAPLLLEGEYVLRLTDIRINGVNFSYDGESGTVLSNTLFECFETIDVSGTPVPSITVNAYTCDNGGGPYDTYYEHRKQYNTSGDGGTPQSLSATFTLSANTEAFVWKFKGFNIYDTLKLVFSGSSYPEPILIEEIRVGSDASTNLTPTVWPKAYSTTSYFKKITVLTGLTVNNGDSIIITVTPNPTQPTTSWDLFFGCSSLPTAEKNCLDLYKDSPYKINSSTITATTASCSTHYVSFSVSGCSTNDNSGFTQSTLAALNDVSSNNIDTNNITNLLNLSFGEFYAASSSISTCGPGITSVCMTTPGNTITVVKTATTQFEFFFSSLSDLAAYYNGYQNAVNTITGQTTCSGYTTDNTNALYYKFVTLRIPTNTGFYLCGDGVTYNDYWLHISSVATSGTTSGGYTMTLTTPLITNGFDCTCIANCSTISSWVGNANTTRNTTTLNVTNTSGLRYNSPFSDTNGTFLSTTSVTARNQSGNLQVIPPYSNLTFPASGVTNTLIPSFSGTTWDWENHFYVNGASNYLQTVFYYRVVVTNFTTTPIEFKIYALPIANFYISSFTYIEVYDSTNPGGADPNYVY